MIRYVVVSNPDEKHSRVQSRHRTLEAAEAKFRKLCRSVKQRYPNALVYLMYGIRTVDGKIPEEEK